MAYHKFKFLNNDIKFLNKVNIKGLNIILNLKISFFAQLHLNGIDKSTLNKIFYYFDELSGVFDFVAWFVVINVFHQSNASIHKISF